MRLVCKVMATLMLATALLQAASVRPIAASSPLSSVEQAWPAGVIFACPINFTIRTGLPNAPVIDKRDERCAPTRSPTILIRGAPFIQTRGIRNSGKLFRSECRCRSIWVFDFQPRLLTARTVYGDS